MCHKGDDFMYEEKRPDGSILYRMTRQVTDNDGNKIRLTARGKSERQVKKNMEQKLLEWQKEQDELKNKTMFPEVNFKVFADNWYKLNIKNANISDTTKSDYKYYLYSNIIPYFEKFKLCDITEDDCQRFLNKYVGYSKANVSKIRMTLRRVLRKAQKQKLIGENPAEDIVLPQVTEGKRRPITDEERALILKQVPNHYAGAMVLTMLCCGLRPAEIRRMEWDWIDFDNAILTVGKSKTKAGTSRKIPMPPQLVKAL